MSSRQVRQSNLTEIINTEHKLLLEAPQNYGEFFNHALQSINLLQTFIAGLKKGGAWLFISFTAHIRKHHLLAFMSIVRRHHTQAFMNLRQVLESGANAAYALGNPKADDFVSVTPEGLLDVRDDLKDKRYKWLEMNYPEGSQAIKAMKAQMQLSSHSNLVDVHRTFKVRGGKKHVQLDTPFFDLENKFIIKGDLWALANIAIGLMDLFYGINQKIGLITFSIDFVPRLQALDADNQRLRAMMMKTRKFKRADKKAKLRDERLKKGPAGQK